MRQVVDLVHQLSGIASKPETRRACATAVDLLRRGVVASTDVGGP